MNSPVKDPFWKITQRQETGKNPSVLDLGEKIRKTRIQWNEYKSSGETIKWDEKWSLKS